MLGVAICFVNLFANCVYFCRPKTMLVYNCTTGGINPFHWGEVGMKPSLSHLNQ